MALVAGVALAASLANALPAEGPGPAMSPSPAVTQVVVAAVTQVPVPVPAVTQVPVPVATVVERVVEVESGGPARCPQPGVSVDGVRAFLERARSHHAYWLGVFESDPAGRQHPWAAGVIQTLGGVQAAIDWERATIAEYDQALAVLDGLAGC